MGEPAPGRSLDGALSRPLIIAATAVAAGWPVAVATIRPRGVGPEAVMRLITVLVAAAPVVLFLRALMSRPVQPAGYDVRPGVGWVVPPDRRFGHFVAAQLILFGLIAATAVRAWAEPMTTAGGLGVFDFIYGGTLSALAVLSGLLTAVTVAAALRGRPRILLTPRSIALEEVLASRDIPWEALRPGQPIAEANQRQLDLIVDQPDRVTRRGVSWRSATERIVLLYSRVSATFLADTIRHYVNHPDRRPAIGTSTEYDQLRTALAAPSA
jgi:hypothetical protein